MIAPRHASKRRALPRKVQKLTANRANRHARAGADIDLSGPASGRDDDRAGCQRSASRFDDKIAFVFHDATRPAALDDLRAMASRGGHQGSSQLAGPDVAVSADQQPTTYRWPQLWFFRASRCGIQQRQCDTACLQPRRDVAERRHAIVG